MSAGDDVLTEREIRRVRNGIQSAENIELNTRRGQYSADTSPDRSLCPQLIKIPTAGIPARSGDVPGRAFCEVIRPANGAHVANEPRQIDVSNTGPKKIPVHNLRFDVIKPAADNNEGLAVPDQYGKFYFVPLGFVQPTAFPVELTNSSGSDGNATTAATYKYDVDDIYGNALATDVDLTASPHKCQRPIGKRTVATYGTAFYKADGTLVVHDFNEHTTFESC